jgi:hypothetical protein
MSTHVVALAMVMFALTLAGCSETTGLTFGDTGVLDGGFGSGGASQAFGERLPQQFRYLYPPGNSSTFDCFTDAHCGLAGRTTQVGNMSNGGESFMFVSTANVPAEHNQGPRTIRTSGIFTISGTASQELTVPDPDQYQSLRLLLDWAFLTARFTPATFNDSAIVRIKAGTDSAVVFRVTSADLEAGRHRLKAGGCGTHAIVSRSITYGTCTDWRTTAVDITAWKSRSFVIQFIVGEAGALVTSVQDQPTTFLFRRAIIEGGK